MKTCSKCGQNMSDELLKEKAKQKSDRIKQARKFARENGEQVGRTRTFDYDKIHELLKNGYSIRSVADYIGCSKAVVQNAKRYLKQPDVIK